MCVRVPKIRVLATEQYPTLSTYAIIYHLVASMLTATAHVTV